MKKLLFVIPAGLSVLLSCQKVKSPPHKVDWTDYRKAYEFLSKQRDSAYYYFNRVVSESRDSLQIAMALNNMAVIQSDAGDYFGAQESLSKSLKFLNEKNKKELSYLGSDYNELGMTSFNLKNYDAALSYYDQAIKFIPDSQSQAIVLDNKANAYQKAGKHRNALRLYKSILPTEKRNTIEYARVLSNLARTKWLADPKYNAAPELLMALNIRKKANDVWGQNASYAHLADYYSRSRPDSALHYAWQMFVTACRLKSPDDKLEALQKLIKLSQPTLVKGYFARYQALNDSLQAARSAAKNQFALIRYNVEKNKADNLILQKDNSEKKYQIIRQSIRFYLTLLAFVGLAVLAFLWYRKRRQRQEQEKRDAVLETRRNASKKVHDTLANDVYQILKKVEHDKTPDKVWLLEHIGDVYDRSRDLSYEIVQDSDHNFHEQVSELLTSFATNTTRVLLVGNSEELWNKINAAVKYEIRYILQELMVNMRKHSQATNVVVKFWEQANDCRITYTDDGIGLPKDTPYKNGLTNTGNRIKAIHGEIIFDTNADKGLLIQLSFPIA